MRPSVALSNAVPKSPRIWAAMNSSFFNSAVSLTGAKTRLRPSSGALLTFRVSRASSTKSLLLLAERLPSRPTRLLGVPRKP